MDKTLSSIERRVLGALIEKSLTQPDNYPISLNAVTMGCNQKSNRDPVMELDEDTGSVCQQGPGAAPGSGHELAEAVAAVVHLLVRQRESWGRMNARSSPARVSLQRRSIQRVSIPHPA